MDEEVKESLVSCRTGQGFVVRGTVQRMSRHGAAFEVYSSATVLQLSEVLEDFRIIVNEKQVYAGKAVVRDVVNTGLTLVCEVSLGEAWQDLDSLAVTDPVRMQEEYGKFIQGWQKVYKILPAFKLVVADVHAFLSDLRIWLEQVELAVRASPADDRLKLERDLVVAVGQSAIPSLDALFDRYEEVLNGVEEPLMPSHRAYAKRQLHPLLLCAPFVYRTFEKPLGYAGDYEMVNMIMREPFDGSNLFAKVINRWFLQQAPATAHRNRIEHLVGVLTGEAARVSSGGGEARILSLGCGPAMEVQRFLAGEHVSNRCRFTLMDFNEETLEHARSALEGAKSRYGRTTTIKLVKKSVNQLLKESGKTVGKSTGGDFDFVYCAGLFDYLSDPVCKRLVTLLYDKVAPGGLLLVTNVDASNPRQQTMESVLDWNLIYRDYRSTGALIPASVPAGAGLIQSDESGVNLFVEIRRDEGV